jgi:hypothetical protein
MADYPGREADTASYLRSAKRLKGKAKRTVRVRCVPIKKARWLISTHSITVEKKKKERKKEKKKPPTTFNSNFGQTKIQKHCNAETLGGEAILLFPAPSRSFGTILCHGCNGIQRPGTHTTPHTHTRGAPYHEAYTHKSRHTNVRM